MCFPRICFKFSNKSRCVCILFSFSSVGAIRFASKADLIFGLDKYTTLKDVQSALKGVKVCIAMNF